MIKATNRSADGTGFHGTTITTTPGKLISLADKLETDFYGGNSGEDKTNFEFKFETSNDAVFTIYDWKEYRKLKNDSIVDFHIGGADQGITTEALYELEQELKTL